MLDDAGVWPVHPKKSLKTAPHSLKNKKQQQQKKNPKEIKREMQTQKPTQHPKRGDHPSETHYTLGPNEKRGVCPKDRRIDVLGVRSESLE